jgi:DNA (cytosine-5)-methyltransferase 1
MVNSKDIAIDTLVSARSKPVFVDVFAGCGGLSLGLMQAGWTGLFAIEKDPFAFETLSTNLISQSACYRFLWPDWLPKESLCVTEFISDYHARLSEMADHVDLLVGGPPCQGYSTAGRRDPDDPRNQLFESYVKLVNILKPTLVLLENVRGITQDFENTDHPEGSINYASKLVELLSADYIVYSCMLNLSEFGVPQNRARFFLIGIRKGHSISSMLASDPFQRIESERLRFLIEKGIAVPLSAKAAISDLEVVRNGTVPSTETKGFQAINYKGPITPYQRLLHGTSTAPLSDTRLARHRPDIAKRFREVIDLCHADGRLNVSLSREVREAFGLKKQAIRVLDPDRPAPTVTSMPDDLLHYAEPRALTVRENARLQSFPDWFVFRGKYTTGGHRRKLEVPRFTQVANAVPPLVAEAIGKSLLDYVIPEDQSNGSCNVQSKVTPKAVANSSKLSL